MTNPQPTQLIPNHQMKLKVSTFSVETLSAKLKIQTKMPTLVISTGSPSHSNKIRKINKRYPNWKESGEIVTVGRHHDTIHI